MLNPPSPVQWKLVLFYSSLTFNLKFCVVVVVQLMSGCHCTVGFDRTVDFLATINELSSSFTAQQTPSPFPLLLVFYPCSAGWWSPHGHQNESSVAGLATVECVSITCYYFGDVWVPMFQEYLASRPQNLLYLANIRLFLTSIITLYWYLVN